MHRPTLIKCSPRGVKIVPAPLVEVDIRHETYGTYVR